MGAAGARRSGPASGEFDMNIAERITARSTRERFRVPVLLALAVLSSCAARTGGQPAPLQRIASYPGALERPLVERISLGHEDLLVWQHKINLKYGQDVRPRKASPSHPLVPKVRSMVAALPEPIRRLASRHLVALYLLEDDWGTGTTEAVQDAQGRWQYAYMALNLTALTRKANAWGSWKEASAFRPRPGNSVRMVLEHPAEDTREAAIRFIFLHELGHAIGIPLGAHGWWDAEKLPRATEHSPFVKISWRKDAAGKMVSRWREKFPGFAELAFYSPDHSGPDISNAEAIYRDLAATDFSSLYATTNLFDDFAEAFAIYVHTKLLGKPYRVEIFRQGKRSFTFRSCISTGTCRAKVRALEALLNLN